MKRGNYQIDLGLKGKVAIITGSSKEIGLETAVSLVREGASVTICARIEDTLKQGRFTYSRTNRTRRSIHSGRCEERRGLPKVNYCHC